MESALQIAPWFEGSFLLVPGAALYLPRCSRLRREEPLKGVSRACIEVYTWAAPPVFRLGVAGSCAGSRAVSMDFKEWLARGSGWIVGEDSLRDFGGSVGLEFWLRGPGGVLGITLMLGLYFCRHLLVETNGIDF